MINAIVSRNVAFRSVKCSKLQIIPAISPCSDVMAETGDGWTVHPKPDLQFMLLSDQLWLDFMRPFHTVEMSVSLQPDQMSIFSSVN